MRERAFKASCRECGREYGVTFSPQQPGCRDTELERCPYCGAVNAESMEWCFETFRIGKHGEEDKD